MPARSARSLAAEAQFRARLADLGAELLGSWQDNRTPVWVRDAAGHDCAPRPLNVLAGEGICFRCRPRGRSLAAEAQFRARLADLGAVMLGPYQDNRTPVWVRDAAGHLVAPRPKNILDGQGPCGRCRPGGRALGDSVSLDARARFLARLEQLGAVLLEPVWLGVNAPHRLICAAGHVGAPQPNHVLDGRGICRWCAGKVWDVFYVVADQLGGRIKFGITSGDPRARLAVHRSAGYRERVLVLEGLPGTVAPEIEAAAIAALTLAGIKPLRGREHYGAEALAVVLDIADNYPRRAA
jgi:hypothetical protein